MRARGRMSSLFQVADDAAWTRRQLPLPSGRAGPCQRHQRGPSGQESEDGHGLCSSGLGCCRFTCFPDFPLYWRNDTDQEVVTECDNKKITLLYAEEIQSITALIGGGVSHHGNIGSQSVTFGAVRA